MKAFWKILPACSVIVPFFVLVVLTTSHTCAQERTLRWDENTDPDLAGYKFYYGLKSRYPNNPTPYIPNCQDYAGVEYSIDGGSTWNSIVCPPPIVVGSGVTEIMFQALADDKVHFFALAAYDVDNLESHYSNEEATLCITWPGGGFFLNGEPGSSNYGYPYTIRGRADKDAVVNLDATQNSTQTPLGSTTADDKRDWSKDVDFRQFSEGPVVLSLESGGISAPDVTAIYDPTDPASQAASATDSGGFVTITWIAADATSGLAWTELWHKPPTDTWSNSGYSAGGTSGTFYYIPTQEDGTFYFATRAKDRAGNWEEEPNGDGDTSINYIAPINPNNPAGKESASGCFISTAAAELFKPLAD